MPLFCCIKFLYKCRSHSELSSIFRWSFIYSCTKTTLFLLLWTFFFLISNKTSALFLLFIFKSDLTISWSILGQKVWATYSEHQSSSRISLDSGLFIKRGTCIQGCVGIMRTQRPDQGMVEENTHAKGIAPILPTHVIALSNFVELFLAFLCSSLPTISTVSTTHNPSSLPSQATAGRTHD